MGRYRKQRYIPGKKHPVLLSITQSKHSCLLATSVSLCLAGDNFLHGRLPSRKSLLLKKVTLLEENTQLGLFLRNRTASWISSKDARAVLNERDFDQTSQKHQWDLRSAFPSPPSRSPSLPANAASPSDYGTTFVAQRPLPPSPTAHAPEESPGPYLPPQCFAAVPRLAVEALGAPQPALRPLQLSAASGQVRLQGRHLVPQGPHLAVGRGGHARPLLSARPPAAATRRTAQSGGRGPDHRPRPWRPAGREGTNGGVARPSGTSPDGGAAGKVSPRSARTRPLGGNAAQPGSKVGKREVTSQGCIGVRCACARRRLGVARRRAGVYSPSGGRWAVGLLAASAPKGGAEAAGCWRASGERQREPGCRTPRVRGAVSRLYMLKIHKWA